MRFLKCLTLLLLLDSLWIAWNYSTTQQVVMTIQQKPLQPRLLSALPVYLLLALGLSELTENSWQGALFGLVVYGVYDLTCYTIFEDFPLDYALKDVVWASLMCFFITYLVG